MSSLVFMLKIWLRHTWKTWRICHGFWLRFVTPFFSSLELILLYSERLVEWLIKTYTYTWGLLVVIPLLTFKRWDVKFCFVTKKKWPHWRNLKDFLLDFYISALLVMLCKSIVKKNMTTKDLYTPKHVKVLQYRQSELFFCIEMSIFNSSNACIWNWCRAWQTEGLVQQV